MNISYRPWVPKEGLQGFWKACVAEWGNPNDQGSEWPQGILEAICERGAPLTLRYDRYAPQGSYLLNLR